MVYAIKFILITACVVGLACTIGAMGAYHKTITAQSKKPHQIATIACTFIVMAIFLAFAVFVVITLHTPCGDRLTGIIGVVAAAFAIALAICAYCVFHEPQIKLKRLLPRVSDWLFAGIWTSFGLLLVSITMIIPQI